MNISPSKPTVQYMGNVYSAYIYMYLLYKAKKPSVCLSVCIFGTLIIQQCLHQLKWDLLEVKAVFMRYTKFILVKTDRGDSSSTQVHQRR